MPSTTLTDTARGLWVESFSIGPGDLGQPASPAWSVAKQALRGGRRDGVDLIRVDNGALSFSVVPTRGMGLWKARYRDLDLAWASPVTDGPVHPSLVDLSASGGLGWLGGFDELMVRCGLASNGPPGGEGLATHTLHGRVANIPAHLVAVEVGDEAPHEIAIVGQVDEASLFGPRLRLSTRISTTPGSNRLVVRDEVTNLKDTPGEMQLLYHWNLGPPLLEEGSRLVAPARAVVPRDPRAAEGIGHFAVTGTPEPGYAEQVYYFDLLGDGPGGRTLTLLRNRAGDKGLALRFERAQLPAFAFWKNTGGLRDGYVVGLEPATNYPNPRPFEAERGRVVALAPGGRYVAETIVEALDSADAVARVEAEVEALQAQGPPTIHRQAVEPFAAEG